jgi:spermidine/putrescine-binding protein
MQKARTHTCQSTGQKTFLLAFAAAMLFLFAYALQSEANIYSWTDSSGVKHFSNSPPPSDKNASIEVHQEIAYDREADEERWELDKKEWEKLKQNLETSEQQIIKERYSQENTKDSPSMAEKINNEKFRLELEISRLEKKPATSFAYDRDGKRAAIAFYKSRLKELETNPERYFNTK